MRRHRFFIERFSEKGTTLSDPDLVHQIGRVLKLRVGEEIALWTGDSAEYIFALEKITAKDVRGRVVRALKNDSESTVDVTLYCALLKRENFELVCQKATEVGVSAIAPLITERTVKTHINSSRIKKIILEAAEQSGRARIPALCDATRFADVMNKVEQGGKNLFFDVGVDVISNVMRNPDIVSRNPRDPSARGLGMTEKINIFIGPEGGWTDPERESAQKAGCEFHSLGALTLRAETAAIVASYFAVQGLL